MEENPVASSHPETAARDSTPVLQPNISVVTKDHAGHEKSLTFLLCFTERFLLAAPPLVLSKKQRRRTTLKELIEYYRADSFIQAHTEKFPSGMQLGCIKIRAQPSWGLFAHQEFICCLVLQN